ncbi:hypothetical protein [Phenylobacterium sp.]|uniref:hypothetical protein n=1 Tax=Phenylobacterium sp. TaxID=1871053 RepID=UPI00356B2142
MNDLTRLLVLLVVAGLAVTVLAGVARWYMDEGRRVRRGLKAVLKSDVHGFLVARGRGSGIGFDFTTNQVAVVWDQGAWGLVYMLDELMGAEVIVDQLVVGRVHRGESRKALDAFGAEERVALRLVFDDPGHPDFVLDLWLPEDEGRRDELPPDESIAEANRWLARIEALLRRPTAGRRSAPPVMTPAAPAPPPVSKPARAQAPFDMQEAVDDDEEPII